MSDREDRLKSLLNKVRAKRPDDRATQAADVLERIRTASGAVPAVRAAQATPPPVASVASSASADSGVSSDFPTQLPSAPPDEPSTSPTLDSPSRYSSQPPRVERPLSVEPRARSVRPPSGTSSTSGTPGTPGPFSSPAPRPSSGAPQAATPPPSDRPNSIRPQSVAPTGQPIVYATDQPEFPRPKTFGDLLELTLSLRPR